MERLAVNEVEIASGEYIVEAESGTRGRVGNPAKPSDRPVSASASAAASQLSSVSWCRRSSVPSRDLVSMCEHIGLPLEMVARWSIKLKTRRLPSQTLLLGNTGKDSVVVIEDFPLP